jgi:minor extracellular serine protease Vpr
VNKPSQAVATALLSLACVALASADAPQLGSVPVAAASDHAVDETPSAWFVELAGRPLADGGQRGQLRNEHAAFRRAARAAGLGIAERHAYESLFNGFSLELPPAEVTALARLPGVVAIYPVETYALPDFDPEFGPQMSTALAMTGASIARDELGLDGSGIRVAIMDTGIDIDHPDFGGNGVPHANSTPFPNAKIVAGYDFVGDAYSGPAGGTPPSPGGRPDDCNGHGTHVAGIVAADGTVQGVAPKALLGSYRVFGCSGNTSADIMLAAMERALEDGMQVLNMSIGASFQWPGYPTAKAADRLVNKGMTVVASIGNSGGSGIYAAGAPGVGDKVIGVASFDNSHMQLRVFTITPDGSEIGYTNATGAPPAPLAGNALLARTGSASSNDDACAELPAGSLANRIALIRRGGCTFHEKASNAQAAGATGVVLYNNIAGRINPTVAGEPAITIPVVAISDSEGLLIDSRLQAGEVELGWTDRSAAFPSPTGGLISGFSSFGLTYELGVKPDIGGPGGQIHSTYPLERGGFATISGTSMSAPHVAGTVALLLQAAPNTSSQAVRTVLQNSAEPKPWNGNPGLGFLDQVHRQGAGMVRIDRAVLATTRVEPGKLALGEGQAGVTEHTLTIENNAAHAVTYTPSFVNATSTGPNSFAPTVHLSNASVAFASSAVTVAAGGSASLTVSVSPATGPLGGIYGGYIVLTPDDDGQVVRVPFAGYIGDYQARQVLAPTASGFPWLARRDESGYVNQPDGDSFSMIDADNRPYFLVHFAHGVAHLRITVEDAVSGKQWHRAFDQKEIARNSSATGFYAIGWDGVTRAGNKTYTVPNGQYTVQLSVLKALGDADEPSHWEHWSSPVITIARP